MVMLAAVRRCVPLYDKSQTLRAIVFYVFGLPHVINHYVYQQLLLIKMAVWDARIYFRIGASKNVSNNIYIIIQIIFISWLVCWI